MTMQAKRYPFPMYPAEIYPLFTGMCVELSIADIPTLREKVVENARDFYSYRGKGLGPHVTLSYQIAEVCHYLLDCYETFGTRERGLIVGAVRYYLMRRDSYDDTKPVVGLDDDIQVMNYVLEELGIAGRFIGKMSSS